MNKTRFIFILFIFTIVRISAQETISGDLYSIDINKQTGRFIPYSSKKGIRKPLLTLTNPISSYILFQYNDEMYISGENKGIFQTTVKKISSSRIEIIQESAYLKIVQNLEISKSQIEKKEFIHYSIELQNKKRSSASIKTRILLDTYLGEQTVPFKTSENINITSEKLLSKREIPEYIVTEESNSESFYVYIPKNNSERPDQLWLANWKRINESSFDPEMIEDRAMSYFPNPENDSAIALFYNWRNVTSGSTKKIDIYMSTETHTEFSKTGFDEKDYNTPEDFQLYTIQSHLKTIDSLLNDIEQIQKNSHPLLDEELLGFYDKLESIKQRKAEYEELQQGKSRKIPETD